jgi:pimeloyl-ACP methyl ester carboxylesterase
MARSEEFDVELEGTPVRVKLDLPDRQSETRPLPAVLLCHGMPEPGADVRRLVEQITEVLNDAGLAVAGIARGSAGAPGTRLAVEAVDDAAAVFHGLALRENLDLEHLGVLGYSLGAIVAACLAKRTDQIHRICLLAPTTTAEVAARLAAESAADVATRLGGGSVPPGFFDGIEALTPAQDLATYERPTLILYGAADRTATAASWAEYRDAILAAHHQVQHLLVALGDHALSNDAARGACLSQIAQFFAAGAQKPTAASRS